MTNPINSFFNPGAAYSDASKKEDQYWNQAQGYAQPFINNGVNQGGILSNTENNLLDPGALEDKWSAGYQPSAYAQQMLKQNQGEGLDAASSMGLMGSSAALNNIQTGAGNIVNQDRQQYMNDLMQKYMTGIGIGQNIYGTGANMAGQMAQEAQKQGDTQAGLAYGEAAAPGALFGKLAGMGINMGLNYATGGLSGAAKAVSSYTG